MVSDNRIAFEYLKHSSDVDGMQSNVSIYFWFPSRHHAYLLAVFADAIVFFKTRSRYRGDTSRNREIRWAVLLVQTSRSRSDKIAHVRKAKPCRARSDIEFDLHRWPSYVHETRRCVVALYDRV